ncbi:UBP1-associated protein 2A-like [Humulus lupulus]|uniref:UBP1-associated protein 2A-like n=1 Tax=Humulus lupulus TaxID=3486 RepID=UPI002B4180CD|nr:UBP1-associated protein 2A-like [Humulus lupulus]XP_062082370.1 UBP1-associated protein 2A-like [Humulus lupulus]XP_062082371.1 UBP1-associated protein 2A-like [Humulus lupulus]XP_062082372.1 UBP1-associated protein 2A-like [Humulus lupulus]XP_062082373.1 UBP1-associated protein 2A-like [Humulus lupulus]
MARKRKSVPKEAPSSAETKPLLHPTAPELELDSQESSSSSSSSSSEEEEEQQVQKQEVEATDSSSEDSNNEEDSASDETSKRDALKNLLEPFGKDQLINTLKEAATSNPSIVSGIVKSVESDPIHRKIFVHGLTWDTTTETLLSAFKQYGAVEECNVVADKVTGRSKGYGFLLFNTRAGARKALKQPQKKIGNRIASCQLAIAGTLQGQSTPALSSAAASASTSSSESGGGGRKIYVSNVGPHISPERLRAFFEAFGEIEDGPWGIDKATGKFKGFALFVYKSGEGMKKALKEPHKVFEGFKLRCSVATECRATKNLAPVVPVSGAGETLAPNNVAIPALQVGLVAQNMNPGAVLMSQNPALGVLNPVLGMGLAPSFPGGVPHTLNRVGAAPTVGINGGFGVVQPNFNGMTPSVVGGYGSQAALQGFGAYQNAQLAQPSVSAAPVAKSQPGAGLVGATTSYLRR